MIKLVVEFRTEFSLCVYRQDEKFTDHGSGNFGLFLYCTAAWGIMCGIFAIL